MPEFSAEVAELYERAMVPVFFEPYAREVARRLRATPGMRVLEIACGTGAVTRELAAALPEGVAIVATDLEQRMLDRAETVAMARPVEWRVADALALPFEPESFDVVVCQFGAMFFPDRVKGFAEMRRVLRAGGRAYVSTWDSVARNDFARALGEATTELCPDDPPRFLESTPHGYHDPAQLASDLAGGGFRSVRVELVGLRSVARSAEDAALALCAGTPVRGELGARGVGIDRAIAEVARHIERFRKGHVVDGEMSALLAEAER